MNSNEHIEKSRITFFTKIFENQFNHHSSKFKIKINVIYYKTNVPNINKRCKNFNLKKNVKYKSKMDINNINYPMVLSNLDITNLTEEVIYSSIKTTLKLEKLTIAEGNHIKNKIKYFKKNQNKYSYIHNLNLNSLDSVLTIRDSTQSSCEIYMINYNKESILINTCKNVVGSYEEWIDEEGEVPKEYKNADNKVLHPINKLPLISLKISKKGALLCDITDGIYREYIYSNKYERFRKTNNIVS